MNAKYILIALLAIFGHITCYAYTISGRILDEATGKPLRKAVFEARNMEGRVVIGIESDQNGRFASAEVADSLLNIEVYRENYDTLRMTLNGLPEGQTDIGDIMLRQSAIALDEVTVTANPVIQGTDKFIVYPSTEEIDRSTTLMGLLTQLQYKLPGLHVVESLQQVTVNGQTPQFLINGRKADYTRIMGLNNSNILRVEYYDTPQLRFGDQPAINFILKPRTDGGSVVANALSAVSTGNINGNIGLTYFKGKSEWNINYGLSWRNYDDRRVSSCENFIGREDDVTRHGEGQPGEFGYTQNNLSIDYTFMPSSRTMFAATIAGTLYRQHLNDQVNITQTIGADIQEYETSTHRNAKLKTPSADLYFRHQVRKNHTFEANAFGAYNDGSFTRDYFNGYAPTQINAMTDNSSWRAGGEVQHRFRKVFDIFRHFRQLQPFGKQLHRKRQP